MGSGRAGVCVEQADGDSRVNTATCGQMSRSVEEEWLWRSAVRITAPVTHILSSFLQCMRVDVSLS